MDQHKKIIGNVVGTPIKPDKVVEKAGGIKNALPASGGNFSSEKVYYKTPNNADGTCSGEISLSNGPLAKYGGGLWLYGKDNSSFGRNGAFHLQAGTEDENGNGVYKALTGYPDGKLTWCNEELVTKKYVDSLAFNGGEVDMSRYATKDELGSYATKTELNSYPLKTALNNYALKTDLNNLASATTVADHISDKDNPHIVTAAQTGALPIGGGAMKGNINMQNGSTKYKITNLADPGSDYDAVNRKYVSDNYATTSTLDSYAKKSTVDGMFKLDTSGNTPVIRAQKILSMKAGDTNNRITGLADPDGEYDAVNKRYVDSLQHQQKMVLATRDHPNIYVDCKANDGGDGSEKKPFRTMDEFFDYCNSCGANSINCFIVRAGTYEIKKRHIFASCNFHIHKLVQGESYYASEDEKPTTNNTILLFKSTDYIIFYGTHYNLTGFTMQFKKGVRFETCSLDLDKVKFEHINDNKTVNANQNATVLFIGCYLTVDNFCTFPHLQLNGCSGLMQNVTTQSTSGAAITVKAGSNLYFSSATKFNKGSYLMDISHSTVWFYPSEKETNDGKKYPPIDVTSNFSAGINLSHSTLYLPQSKYTLVNDKVSGKVIVGGEYSTIVNNSSANYVGGSYT